MVKSKKPLVEVLVSTYNGEKFIQAQLESILAQNDVDVHCLIRDDGSSDGTVKILKRYVENSFGKVSVIIGLNIGFFKSFHELVRDSGSADYYAFSDQDDVWLKDKLVKCISHLNPNAKVPEMCFCNSKLVDSDLSPIRDLFDNKDIVPQEKHRRVLECLTAGCAIVYNRPARDAFLKGDKDVLTIHDFWLYVLCTYLGNVYYEPTPLILYRQHSNNVIGNKSDFKTIWRSRIKQLRNLTHRRETIASELIRNFKDEIPVQDINKVIPIRDYRNSLKDKFKLLFSKDYTMPTRKKTFWFKMHVLLGNV